MRGALCRYEATGLRCFHEGEAGCAANGACPGTAIPFDRLVLLEFQPASGEYRMVDRLDAATYDPRARVSGNGPTKRQRRVLFQTFDGVRASSQIATPAGVSMRAVGDSMISHDAEPDTVETSAASVRASGQLPTLILFVFRIGNTND